MANSDSSQSSWKFVWRNFILTPVIFVVIYLIFNILVNITCNTIISFDCPVTWPISIFSIRMATPLEVVFGIVLIGIAGFGSRWLSSRDYPFLQTLALALVLLVGSSAMTGWLVGFVVPITYGEEIYYNDMLRFDDPVVLIQDYEQLQRDTLFKHARTNPPGAMLNLFVLSRLIPDTGAMSLLILIISGSISGWFLWRIMQLIFPDDRPLWAYAVLLFLCIPAIQIYYTHSVDPIVATGLLGTLFFVLHHDHRFTIIGAIICLFIASFTSFLAIFVLPILLGLALIHAPYRRRVLVLLLSIVGLYIVIYITLGFNYIQSFMIASSFENPDGMRLFSDTATYIATRLESMAEIILFFTPFMFIMLVRGAPLMRQHASPVLTASGFGLISFLGMMALGVMSTGEAARAMVFIYPYLLFPVIYAIREFPEHRTLLVCLVYGQTIVMQMIGIYFA